MCERYSTCVPHGRPWSDSQRREGGERRGGGEVEREGGKGIMKRQKEEWGREGWGWARENERGEGGRERGRESEGER